MAFWRQDILDLIKRIFILGEYCASPYVMRFEKYRESPFYGAYVTIAGWCNRFSTFKKTTLKQYVDNEARRNRRAPERYMEYAMQEIPELKNYYDILAYGKEVNT